MDFTGVKSIVLSPVSCPGFSSSFCAASAFSDRADRLHSVPIQSKDIASNDVAFALIDLRILTGKVVYRMRDPLNHLSTAWHSKSTFTAKLERLGKKS